MTSQHVPHKFDLHGTAVGDSFQGCPVCGFRLNSGEAMKPVCPKCYSEMLIYTVTAYDIKDGAKARST